MLHARRHAALLLSLVLFLPLSRAHAQGSDDESPPPPSLSASALTHAADVAAGAIRRAKDIAKGHGELEHDRALLVEVQARVETLNAGPLLEQLSSDSRRVLIDLRQSWRRPERLTEEAQSELRPRIRELRKARNELRKLEEEWKARREGFRGEDVPSRIRVLVEATADDLSRQRRELDELLSTHRELYEGLSTEALQVSTVMGQIEDALARIESNLWKQNAPPIWAARADEGRSRPFLDDLESTVRTHRTLFADGIRDERTGLGEMAITFVILLFVLVYQWRRSDHWEGDASALALARHVVSAPLASALLGTLIFTPLFLRTAPTIFYDVIFLTLLYPILRLLPPLLPGYVRPLVYGFAAALVLRRFSALLPHGTFHREMILVEAVVTGSWLGFWRLRQGASGSRALKTAVSIALVVLAFSLVTSLLGWEQMAGLALKALMSSVYVGMLLFAGALVLEAVTAALVRNRFAMKLHMVRAHHSMLMRRMSFGVRALALVLWLFVVSWNFRFFRPLRGAWSWLVERSMQLGSVDISLGKVLAFFFTIVAARYLARLVRFVLEEEILARIGLSADVSTSIGRLAGYGVVTVGLLLALATLGIDPARLAMLASALSVGIGFGLQNIVSNFMSGLILIAERPVKVGDFIEVGDLIGEVKRIGIRASTVRALDGAEVIVPNAELISKEVVNWTLSDRHRRVRVDIGVAYGTDPHRVQGILTASIGEMEEVLRHPAPAVHFVGFGNSSLDFACLCWVSEFADHIKITSDITLRVHDAIANAGIEIPFPQRDLHLRSVAEEIPLPGAPKTG